MTRNLTKKILRGSAISSLPDEEIRLPKFVVEINANNKTIKLDGVWTSRTVGVIDEELRRVDVSEDAVTIDCAQLTMLDTAGAWMIVRLQRKFQSQNKTVNVAGLALKHHILVDAVLDASVEEEHKIPEADKGNFAVRILNKIGRGPVLFYIDFMRAMNILGAAVRGSQLKSGHHNQFSFAPIVSQIEEIGIGAIPVVVLMSSIMGGIVAQQGAFQLRYFGAEVYVVDLVGLLILREMGVLFAAVMIAGRSGSAITAEIGSMKMREEVDALHVIGLSPIGVLVFPRIAALVIALPLLTFIGDISALGGAMFVADIYSNISPVAFIHRVREAIDMGSFFVGMIKAPFMAIIIGVIAAVEGLKVEGSAESLGRRVTSSVVKAIFVVVVVDGLFAMFFAAVNI